MVNTWGRINFSIVKSRGYLLFPSKSQDACPKSPFSSRMSNVAQSGCKKRPFSKSCSVLKLKWLFKKKKKENKNKKKELAKSSFITVSSSERHDEGIS